MLASIPGFLRTPMVVLLIVLSTIVHTTPLFLVAFLKWIVPVRGFRSICAIVLVRLAAADGIPTLARVAQLARSPKLAAADALKLAQQVTTTRTAA